MPPKQPDKPLPSLETLQAQIDAVKPKQEANEPSSAGMAMRAGVELVAGVAVGSAVGLLLDRWLGTMPVFFLICFALGTAGGVRNLMRGARDMEEQETQLDKDTQTP